MAVPAASPGPHSVLESLYELVAGEAFVMGLAMGRSIMQRANDNIMVRSFEENSFEDEAQDCEMGEDEEDESESDDDEEEYENKIEKLRNEEPSPKSAIFVTPTTRDGPEGDAVVEHNTHSEQSIENESSEDEETRRAPLLDQKYVLGNCFVDDCPYFD